MPWQPYNASCSNIDLGSDVAVFVSIESTDVCLPAPRVRRLWLGMPALPRLSSRTTSPCSHDCRHGATWCSQSPFSQYCGSDMARCMALVCTCAPLYLCTRCHCSYFERGLYNVSWELGLRILETFLMSVACNRISRTVLCSAVAIILVSTDMRVRKQPMCSATVVGMAPTISRELGRALAMHQKRSAKDMLYKLPGLAVRICKVSPRWDGPMQALLTECGFHENHLSFILNYYASIKVWLTLAHSATATATTTCCILLVHLAALLL